MVGLVGSAVLAVVAFLMVTDVYGRLRQSLDITAEAVQTVDTTLEVASDALLTLGRTVDTVRTATEQAAESSELVERSVSEAAAVVGTDLPETIDAMRETMPALIEASTVIDSTLRGLSFFGVPYDPEVPLGEGFRRLDEELAPLSDTLRANGAVMEGLVPSVGGFQAQTELLVVQVEEIGEAVDEASEVIDSYQTQADAFDDAIQSARDSTTRGSLWMRALVVLAGLIGMAMSAGLYLTGRALEAAS
ncbi:MAG TPA: hypothetical protein VF246_10165 [Acidimicrobiia bacterium]